MYVTELLYLCDIWLCVCKAFYNSIIPLLQLCRMHSVDSCEAFSAYANMDNFIRSEWQKWKISFFDKLVKINC